MKQRKPIIRKVPLKKSTKPIARKTPIRRTAIKKKLPSENKFEARIIVIKKKEENVSTLLKKAIFIFNASIRKRDSDGSYFQCISCSKVKNTEEAQCGHYMPGTYSELKFNEFNCHAECVTCNCIDKDHLIGYRINLIKKIGLPMVEWLESHSIAANFKWDREFLKGIINKYKI